MLQSNWILLKFQNTTTGLEWSFIKQSFSLSQRCIYVWWNSSPLIGAVAHRECETVHFLTPSVPEPLHHIGYNSHRTLMKASRLFTSLLLAAGWLPSVDQFNNPRCAVRTHAQHSLPKKAWRIWSYMSHWKEIIDTTYCSAAMHHLKVRRIEGSIALFTLSFSLKVRSQENWKDRRAAMHPV